MGSSSPPHPPPPSSTRTSPLLITTAHLESTAEGPAPQVRREQYTKLLQDMIAREMNVAQVVCGDFNLRVKEDYEIRKALGLGKVRFVFRL